MMRFGNRDEREAGVDLVADRLALLVVSYGLLAVVAYRAFALGEQAWDLMALLVLSGVIGFGYRVRAGVASRTLALIMVGAAALAVVVALVLGAGLGR
ncbi:MAG TPA: hypothetical protein VF484_08505 [Candidatus Limnocylindrales bacterium]